MSHRYDCVVCQASVRQHQCEEITLYGERFHICEDCDLSQQEAIEPAADEVCAEAAAAEMLTGAEALAAIEPPPLPQEIVAPRVRGFLGLFARRAA